MRRIKINVERIFLRAPYMNVCMKADIDGEVSAEQLYAAIDRLGIIHPLLRASIEVDDNGKAYYVMDSVETITPRWLDINKDETAQKKQSGKKGNIEYIDSDQNDWQEVLMKYDNRIFDMINGPLIRFIMIHQKGMASLIVVGHHLLGDGMSYTYLIKDLLSIMGKPDTEIKEKMPPLLKNDNYLPGRTKLHLITRCYINNLNKKWSKDKRVFSDSEYHNMFERYRKEYKPLLKMIHIDSYSMLKIKNKCHEHKVTVNELIIAAFLSAMQQVVPEHQNKKDRIGIAVNIRKDLRKNPYESMGNFASGVSIEKIYNKEVDLWSNASDIRKSINKKLRHIYSRFILLQFLNKIDKTLIDAAYFSVFDKYENKTASTVASIIGASDKCKGLGVTNLGAVDIPTDYGKYKLKDLSFICPDSPNNDITVGVVTLNGKMNISVRYTNHNISENQISKVCEKAMSIINE